MKPIEKHVPVQVVEEWQEIEGEFDPAFLLCPTELVCIHNRRRIIQSGAAHHRSVHVPEQHPNKC